MKIPAIEDKTWLRSGDVSSVPWSAARLEFPLLTHFAKGLCNQVTSLLQNSGGVIPLRSTFRGCGLTSQLRAAALSVAKDGTRVVVFVVSSNFDCDGLCSDVLRRAHGRPIVVFVDLRSPDFAKSVFKSLKSNGSVVISVEMERAGKFYEVAKHGQVCPPPVLTPEDVRTFCDMLSTLFPDSKESIGIVKKNALEKNAPYVNRHVLNFLIAALQNVSKPVTAFVRDALENLDACLRPMLKQLAFLKVFGDKKAARLPLSVFDEKVLEHVKVLRQSLLVHIETGYNDKLYISAWNPWIAQLILQYDDKNWEMYGKYCCHKNIESVDKLFHEVFLISLRLAEPDRCSLMRALLCNRIGKNMYSLLLHDCLALINDQNSQDVLAKIDVFCVNSPSDRMLVSFFPPDIRVHLMLASARTRRSSSVLNLKNRADLLKSGVNILHSALALASANNEPLAPLWMELAIFNLLIGNCLAGNEYFLQLYNLNNSRDVPSTAVRWFSQLVKKGVKCKKMLDFWKEKVPAAEEASTESETPLLHNVDDWSPSVSDCLNVLV